MLKGGQGGQEPGGIWCENPWYIKIQELFGSHIVGTSTVKSCGELAGLTTHEGLNFSDINVRNLTKILVNITRSFSTFYLTKPSIFFISCIIAAS